MNDLCKPKFNCEYAKQMETQISEKDERIKRLIEKIEILKKVTPCAQCVGLFQGN